MFVFVSRRLLELVSSPAAVAAVSSVIIQTRYGALAQCEDLRKSRCEEFNSTFNILFKKGREELCKAEPGCDFRGKGITGICYPTYKKTKLRRQKKVQLSEVQAVTSTATIEKKEEAEAQLKMPDPAPSRVIPRHTLPKGPVIQRNKRSLGLSRVEGGTTVEVLKEHFTPFVADQIVNSHEAARQIAKELVIEVLQNKETVNELGSLLGLCFSYPTVQLPIRSLTYSYLHADVTMENTLWLLELQRHYFFKGEGQDWTRDNLRDLFVWWTTTQDFKSVVYPLVLWVLRDRDITVVPLGQLNADYYKYYQDWFARSVESAVVDHLISERDNLKFAASNVLKEMLTSHYKSKAGSENESGGEDASDLEDKRVAKNDKESVDKLL